MTKQPNNTIRAITIDDEFLARENLKMLLNEFCEGVEIVGEAGNVKEAIAVIEKTSPDVIFLDIRMPSGAEGFELLDAIPEKKFQVVFVTAFKDYAIKAFKANAIHYILKPVDIDDLMSAVEKVKSLKTELEEQPDDFKAYFSKLEKLSDELRNKSSNRITISHTKGIKIVDNDSIVRLNAEGNCTKLHFDNGSSYLDTRTLKIYEGLLQTNNFVRVHKSHIINLDFLSEYSNQDGHFAIMKNGDHVPISRARISDFITLVKQLN